MTRRFPRYPNYDEDSDYTTNANSYYKELGRKQKLIQYLAEKIGVHLERAEQILIDLVNKIGEGFNQEIEDLLIQWVEDGTIDHIINETLMNQKADKVDLEALDDRLTTEISNFKTATNGKIDDFKTATNGKIDDFKTVIDDDIGLIQSAVSVLDEHVSKDHYYLDDPLRLQEAINEAKGGILFLKKQVYNIDQTIKVPSNTTIVGNGAIFKGNSELTLMVVNDSKGMIGGYGANENINIIDIVFDANHSKLTNVLCFAHSKNIKILDCFFKDLQNLHMIELNSSKNVLIENCHFYNYGTDSLGTEMVQIDLAKGSAQFRWEAGKPYDNTTCKNIKIRNNKFEDSVRGIGSHSWTDQYFHERITIEKNEFINMRQTAIKGLDWSYVKILSNHISDVYRGIWLRTKGSRLNNFLIEDNYLSGLENDPQSRGIVIEGDTINERLKINGGSIVGNRVKRFGSHGIGINYSDRWVIEGNDVTSSGKNGILIYGAVDTLITNNNVYNNNLSETTDVDISVQKETKNTIINNNNVYTIKIGEASSIVSIMNNLVAVSIAIYSENNAYGVNNIVKGLLVPTS